MPSKPTPLMMMCLALLASAGSLQAEPCFVGFPDPPQRGGRLIPALQRTGVQRTFLFHRAGLQDIVVRPSFTGRVEEFGMVLPFPVAPAVRKVDGAFFAQLDALLEPERFLASAPQTDSLEAESLKLDEVRVVREEVVGMYQVATLEAGSSEALIRWLDGHAYRYPPAMGPICEEYVAKGWVFVVVKVDLTGEGAVTPRPGMREVRPGMPVGSVFSGPIQGMGFRFPCPTLVLSAKLASLNDRSQMTSRIYVLAERPGQFAQLDPSTVRERVSGAELVRRSASLGGGAGTVLDQFLSTLHASNTGELAESDAWKAHREALVADLSGMTLTVVEGDLPRAVLREHDLTFTGADTGAEPVPVQGVDGSHPATPADDATLSVGGTVATILLALAFGAVLMRETR